MTPEQIAQTFHQARASGTALSGFPGDQVPADLASAYRIQDIAIKAWPDEVVAWKVALIAPAFQARYGDVRVAGPVFSKRLTMVTAEGGNAAGTDAVTNPVTETIVDGGYAAVETEFAILVNDRFPVDTKFDNPMQLKPFIAAVHAAIEVAGSPLATLSALGPGSVISDFGNNTALLIGPELPDFFAHESEYWSTAMQVNGTQVGEGHAGRIPDGPLTALFFLVNNLVSRGTTLRAGQWVSTGASNGIHPVKPGDEASAQFRGETLLSVQLRS